MFVGYHKSMLNVKVRLNCPVFLKKKNSFSLCSRFVSLMSVFFFFILLYFFSSIGFRFIIEYCDAAYSILKREIKRYSYIIIFSTVMVNDCKYSLWTLLIKIIHQSYVGLSSSRLVVSTSNRLPKSHLKSIFFVNFEKS